MRSKPMPHAQIERVLRATEPLWEQLRNGGLFLTGGTGFFGAWLLESFLHANARLGLGAQLTVLSRDPARFLEKAPHLAQSPAIHFVTGDLLNLTPELPIRHPLTHVIHAGTAVSAELTRTSPLTVYDSIEKGTRSVLELACAKGVNRFLLTSSGAVYGAQPAELPRMSETYPGAPDPLHPFSAYAQGKRAAEHLCALYHQKFGLPTQIARCFAFSGAGLPLESYALGNFLQDALNGKDIVIRGDGSPVRSYMDAADLTIWLWTLLFQGAPLRAYNVGSEESVTLRELAERIARRLGARVRVLGEKTQGLGNERYVPCTERARSELGLAPPISLDDSLSGMIDWLKS